MPDKLEQPPTRQRPGGMRGRYAVFITLSLFVLVPAVSVGIGLSMGGGIHTVDLDYNKRSSWFVQPVKPRPLKYSKFVAAETGKQYKKTDLAIAPEVEHILNLCVRWAQDEDFANNTKAVDSLKQFAADADNGFYPPYLLAAWHQLNGNQAEHDRWMRVAFKRAGGAICQRFVDEQGEPVSGYAIPPVAIGYDRVEKGKLNATLMLVYPGLTTDDQGMAYLPTFRSVYRFTDPALPFGSDPGLHPTKLTLLPQPLNGTEPFWFSVPDGAVGKLPDAVIQTPE